MAQRNIFALEIILILQGAQVKETAAGDRKMNLRFLILGIVLLPKGKRFLCGDFSDFLAF